MNRPILRTLSALLLIFGGSNVFAFVNLPVLLPANPLEGQPVSIIVRSGHCDALNGKITFVQEGTFVRVLVDGVRSEAICGFPQIDHEFALGSFAAGNYTLQLDYRYYTGLDPTDTVTETIGTIQFFVTPAGGGATVPIPSMDLAGRLGLALSLLAISAIALRWRLR